MKFLDSVQSRLETTAGIRGQRAKELAHEIVIATYAEPKSERQEYLTDWHLDLMREDYKQLALSFKQTA